jgi:serine/threonine protein kinase
MFAEGEVLSRVHLNDFTKGDRIGSGSFGHVFKARRKSDNHEVALKFIFANSPSDLEHVNQEISILYSQNHQTLLKCLGYVPFDKDVDNSPVIVLEFAERGSLKQYIESEHDGKVDPKWTLTRKHLILYSVALGLSISHKQGIIHRDIKPENILLDRMFEPKIGDFGCACHLDRSKSLTTAVGTARFMAPEVMDSGDYGTPADVYSFGMLAYVLLTGLQPFPDVTAFLALARKVQSGERPSIPSNTPKLYRELIEACWDPNPAQRPAMRHVVAMFSSFLCLNDGLDISTFLAYKRRFGQKAKIKRLSGSPGQQMPFKIVFLGESKVGKSYIFDRLNGRAPRDQSTMGCDFFPFGCAFTTARTCNSGFGTQKGQNTRGH